MVEIVSWFGVAVIALFALTGFVGVVATSLVCAVRAVRHPPVAAEASDAPHFASAA
jgi:hypothetical protein